MAGASDTVAASVFASNQRRILIAVFAALSAALVAGYLLFMRVDYSVLYTSLKPADAAAIVAELDAKGVPHRLRDDGTTILVPAAEVDGVRLAVAGSDIPMKGSVGFELFNKSDMGLTDFAQKINYQRALQGELARTIMMMEGIETARIHLAIPERSLFRGSQGTPKAAVEVIAAPNRPLTPDRVAGIQQLVAAAVPDLPLAEVVVLDGHGRIISRAPSPALPAGETDEQAAVQNYYSARVRSALSAQMPGLRFDVRTLVLRDGSFESGGVGGGVEASRGERDFRLRLIVLTLQPLPAEDQTLAREAIARAVSLNEGRGDSVAFEVGPVTPPTPAPMSVPAAAAAPVDAVAGSAGTAGASAIPWLALAGIAFAGLLLWLLTRTRRTPPLTPEVDGFVERVRAQLAAREPADVRG